MNWNLIFVISFNVPVHRRYWYNLHFVIIELFPFKT